MSLICNKSALSRDPRTARCELVRYFSVFIDPGAVRVFQKIFNGFNIKRYETMALKANSIMEEGFSISWIFKVQCILYNTFRAIFIPVIILINVIIRCNLNKTTHISKVETTYIYSLNFHNLLCLSIQNYWAKTRNKSLQWEKLVIFSGPLKFPFT